MQVPPTGKRQKQHQKSAREGMSMQQGKDAMTLRQRLSASDDLSTHLRETIERHGIHLRDPSVENSGETVGEIVLLSHSEIPFSFNFAASALFARKQ